jgi:hypothetical protein
LKGIKRGKGDFKRLQETYTFTDACINFFPSQASARLTTGIN